MSEQTVTEARNTDSRLDLVRKLLAKAESTDSDGEREALNERAADLIAKYGIDRAMLAASGQEADAITDRVIWVVRPFSEDMISLLWNIAYPLRATGRTIRQWDETAHGGRKKGAWKYGLRLFAHASDMARIELLYVSLRNQALAGASRIVDRSSQFGQTQKAERQSYLEGFRSAVYLRIARAEQAAEQAREAERQELADKAMLAGTASAGPSVALVLADRRKAVELAMDTAYGITQASRARWAEQAEEDRKRRDAEKAECPRCKNGRPCSKHFTAKGRPVTERVGTQYWNGYHDGEKADLGPASPELPEETRQAIG